MLLPTNYIILFLELLADYTEQNGPIELIKNIMNQYFIHSQLIIPKSVHPMRMAMCGALPFLKICR